MRVAVNVEQLLYPSPGGVGRYTARLASLLPTLFAGDEVLAFTARHPSEAVRAALAEHGVAGADPVVLPLPRPLLYELWSWPGTPPPARMAPALARADLVHAPSVAVPPRGRSPLIVTVHDAAPVLYPGAFTRRGLRFHLRGLEAAARRADLILTVSAAAAEEISARTAIDPGRLRVVPNGVDPVTVDPGEARRVRHGLGLGDRPYVLWVGSLEPRKNVGTLVTACALLARRGSHPDLALVLAGYPGWLGDDLIPSADRAALGSSLHQVGRVDDPTLWALYAGATVAAVPSRHEGFGYPVVEAMAQGVPVVRSAIPVLDEVGGGATIAVPADDAVAWADTIAGLLDDPAARAELGRAGRRRAARFTATGSVRGIRDVYLEALGA